MNKKRALLLLVVLSLLFSLVSCSDEKETTEVVNREFNASEVEAAAKDLLEKSLLYNEILFGKGLAYEDGEGTGIYKKATVASLEKNGISSISDLKSRLNEIYSSKYMESLNNSDIFGSVKDGENIKFYPRYYDSTDDEGNICVYVNSVYEYNLKNKYEYISEPRASHSIGDQVVLLATVRVTMEAEEGKEPKTKDVEHEIRLIEENGSWRLYSSTYVVYNKYNDIYENMNK